MSGARNDKVTKLRRHTERFLEGQPVSANPELRLSTVRSVLQYLLHVHDESNDKHTTTKETIECVMRLWAKCGIKTQLYRNCIRKLETLWMQWRDINKEKTRNDDERREWFSRKMDSLWDSSAEGTSDHVKQSFR